MQNSFKKKVTSLSKNFFIVLVLTFLYLPILVTIIYSFNTSKMNILFEGFTTSWYQTMFYNRNLMEAFQNSLIVGIVSTLIATIIGTLGAVGMHKYSFLGKNFLDKVLYIPVVIPEIVLGIALLSIYSFMNITLGLFTIIIAHITFCIPFVLITVRARISGLDNALVEAAMDLGANTFQAFFKVTLPLLMPGVLSGAMLSFTLSLDDVIISFFTNGPDSITLPLEILSMVRTGVTPEANALSTMIMIVTMLIVCVSSSIQVKRLKKGKVEEVYDESRHLVNERQHFYGNY